MKRVSMTAFVAAMAVGPAYAAEGSSRPMLFMLAIFAAMFLIPIGYFYAAYRTDKKLAASQTWSSAPGIVTKSGYRKQQSKGNVWYSPELAYRFDVAGKAYQGKRLRFGMDTTRTVPDMVALLAPYPLEGPVQVYYDPNNPKDNVLVRHAESKGYRRVAWIFAIALIVIFAVVAAMVLIK